MEQFHGNPRDPEVRSPNKQGRDPQKSISTSNHRKADTGIAAEAEGDQKIFGMRGTGDQKPGAGTGFPQRSKEESCESSFSRWETPADNLCEA